MPRKRRYKLWECSKCMRKAQTDANGKLLANCEKQLHVTTGDGPGSSFGSCVALSTIEFANYQDAVAWYQSDNAKLPAPWGRWVPGKRPNIGTGVKAICPNCPGANSNTTRR